MGGIIEVSTNGTKFKQSDNWWVQKERERERDCTSTIIQYVIPGLPVNCEKLKMYNTLRSVISTCVYIHNLLLGPRVSVVLCVP